MEDNKIDIKNNDIEYRQLNMDDVSSAHELHHNVWNSLPQDKKRWLYEKSKKEIEDLIRDKNNLIYGAIDNNNNRVVGMIVYTKLQNKDFEKGQDYHLNALEFQKENNVNINTSLPIYSYGSVVADNNYNQALKRKKIDMMEQISKGAEIELSNRHKRQFYLTSICSRDNYPSRFSMEKKGFHLLDLYTDSDNDKCFLFIKSSVDRLINFEQLKTRDLAIRKENIEELRQKLRKNEYRIRYEKNNLIELKKHIRENMKNKKIQNTYKDLKKLESLASTVAKSISYVKAKEQQKECLDVILNKQAKNRVAEQLQQLLNANKQYNNNKQNTLKIQ